MGTMSGFGGLFNLLGPRRSALSLAGVVAEPGGESQALRVTAVTIDAAVNVSSRRPRTGNYWPLLTVYYRAIDVLDLGLHSNTAGL